MNDPWPDLRADPEFREGMARAAADYEAGRVERWRPYRWTAEYQRLFRTIEQHPLTDGWEHWECVLIADAIVRQFPKLLPPENRPRQDGGLTKIGLLICVLLVALAFGLYLRGNP